MERMRDERMDEKQKKERERGKSKKSKSDHVEKGSIIRSEHQIKRV